MAKKPVVQEKEDGVPEGCARVRFDTLVGLTINGAPTYYPPGEFVVDEAYLASLGESHQQYVRL